VLLKQMLQRIHMDVRHLRPNEISWLAADVNANSRSFHYIDSPHAGLII